MDKKSQGVDIDRTLTVFNDGTWALGSGKLQPKPHRTTVMNRIRVHHATDSEIEHLKRNPHDSVLLQDLKKRDKLK